MVNRLIIHSKLNQIILKKTFILQRFVLVTFTFLISALMYVDRACIGAAKGSVSDEFGLSNFQWAWVMAAFNLGYHS